MFRHDSRTSWPLSGTAAGWPEATPTRTSRRSAPRMRRSKLSMSNGRAAGRKWATSLFGEAARLASNLSWSARVGPSDMGRIITVQPTDPGPQVAARGGGRVSSGRERRLRRSAPRHHTQALRSPPPHPFLVLAARPRSARARLEFGPGRGVRPGEGGGDGLRGHHRSRLHRRGPAAPRGAPERSAEIIVGEEVETLLPESGQRLHVNVFGLDEAAHREVQGLRRDVRELVAYLRHRGLLHVLNHPFWSYRFQRRPRAYVEEILDLFDHFEAGNSTMPSGHAEAVEAMLRYAAALGLRKTAVAGSDAHVPDHVASSFTLARGDTAAAWLASVARGECTYAASRIGFPSLLSHVYRAVGSYYREMARPEGRAGMRDRKSVV